MVAQASALIVVHVVTTCLRAVCVAMAPLAAHSSLLRHKGRQWLFWPRSLHHIAHGLRWPLHVHLVLSSATETVPLLHAYAHAHTSRCRSTARSTAQLSSYFTLTNRKSFRGPRAPTDVFTLASNSLPCIRHATGRSCSVAMYTRGMPHEPHPHGPPAHRSHLLTSRCVSGARALVRLFQTARGHLNGHEGGSHQGVRHVVPCAWSHRPSLRF